MTSTQCGTHGGKTQAGKPCRNKVVEGEPRCSTHIGMFRLMEIYRSLSPMDISMPVIPGEPHEPPRRLVDDAQPPLS